MTRRAPALLCVALVQAGLAAAAVDGQLAASVDALTRLSIEELAEIEISSAFKRPERLADVPAAVYVITREQMRRAGVVTLPEALRLAPNLQVARVNAHRHAISARGFNGTSANKLLVMIDGRRVYTPLHSGVFWDAQDVSLHDVDRIEVASGPGGTLWGANAVNGVINVVSRSAKDTAGLLVSPVIGDEVRGLTLRQGWRLGDEGGARVYAKSFRHEHSTRADGSAQADAWRHSQAGFRSDWGAAALAWTLQGDVYEGKAQDPARPDRRVSGANLLARWSRDLGPRSSVQVQAYLDNYKRKQPGFFTESLDTVDVDVQHQSFWGGAHELVWGGGFRHQRDRTSGGALLAFVPADSRLHLANVFVQDTVALRERLKLTMGLKLEHNSYTGLEIQPNVRLAWKRDEQSLLWAALSRAVRTPSRLDRDFQLMNLPPPYSGRLFGGPGFRSEVLTAFEVGWRAQPSVDSTVSISTFYNRYDRLRSVESNGSGGFVLGNGVQGHAVGMEAWGSVQLTPAWRVDAGLSLLDQRLRFAAGSTDPGSPESGGNDPEHQFMLRSNWMLRRHLSFDIGLRAVAALPAPAVPAYTAFDAHLAWNPRPDVELSIAGFNLFDDAHAEFGAPAARSEFGRRVVLRAIWSL